jgi:hypothetical protein
MSSVKIASVADLWKRNKANAWDNGTSPEDVFRFIDDGVPLHDESEVESVLWWLERLQDGRDLGEDEFIFTEADGEIVDGYHRLTAARLLGLKTFPVTVVQ